MGRKSLTQEEVIKRFNIIHPNNRYGYDEVEYINTRTKIKIVCLVEGHGAFYQTPHHHLKGHGCPDCGNLIRKRKTTEQFIFESNLIHNDKYDYSKVKYIHSNSKVIITCPIEGHGDFKTTPDCHFKGSGCQICNHINISKTNEQFIKEGNTKHNNFYTYPRTNYINCGLKVIITCPIHGDFPQTPSNHLAGSGCPECAYKKLEGGYSYEKALQGHYKFSGYLYIIRMYNNEESFIKIGISINLKLRMIHLKSQSKYKIKIIKTNFYKDFNQAIIKEHNQHIKFKEFSYLPENKFNGRYECFTEDFQLKNF